MSPSKKQPDAKAALRRLAKSPHEAELAFQLKHATPFQFVEQYKFHPEREWRSDFAIFGRVMTEFTRFRVFSMDVPLLVEVEGGIRGKPGRHQRIDGMEADCEKYAEAMLMGFRVLRVMPRQVKSGVALQWIERMVAIMEKETP